MKFIETTERLSPEDLANNYLYQRSKLAYVESAKLISGNVLEIGTGNGYGIQIVASKADKFVTIDKYEASFLSKIIEKNDNVEFIKANVPPLKQIADNSFDFVITFQLIEHIKQDGELINEIHRVLKPGGKVILTTPNKKMSLSRNPWHIREYTVEELETLLLTKFKSVEKLGTYGNEKVMNYIEQNKKSVDKIMRFDIFNLQYKLPRIFLQIPYDILNRVNRKRLLKNSDSAVSNILLEDFFLKTATDECLDLFYIAEKNSGIN